MFEFWRIEVDVFQLLNLVTAELSMTFLGVSAKLRSFMLLWLLDTLYLVHRQKFQFLFSNRVLGGVW